MRIEEVDDLTLNTMTKRGGGFIQSLVECWYHADSSNRKRLFKAFYDKFVFYRDFGIAEKLLQCSETGVHDAGTIKEDRTEDPN
jgi:hypothetical protein